MNYTIKILILLFCLSTAFGVENVLVYQEDGKFCGWPANEGIWSWGDEIVVGFVLGEYVYNDPGHDCNLSGPLQMVQARSTDGGLTWQVEKPEVFNHKKTIELNESIDFARKDFALKCRNDKFYYSYNRCREWQGQFIFPEFGCLNLQARTDYIVNSKDECFIFITSDKVDGIEGQTFCIKTSDGGKSFNFLSWVAPCPPIMAGPHAFSAQTATLRLSSDTLISGVRERRNKKNWIDIYISNDNAQSWQFLSRPIEMPNNPPDILKLTDGRICLVYGSRLKPEGIHTQFSDDGKTWTKPFVLRNDGREWDLGYVRSIQRSDGKVVSIYYYTTEEIKKQHIAATIWDPNEYE